MKLDVSIANTELQEKSYELIQKETSLKWGARALASFTRSQTSKNIELKMRWFGYAIEYMGEALEHAAFSNDTQLQKDLKETLNIANIKTVEEIKKWKVGG